MRRETSQADARFLRTIRVENLLSFGPDGEEFECGNLNVLVGANGSGKSNLIETIGLMASLPEDLAGCVRQGGGITDWLHKGADRTPKAQAEVTLNYPDEFERNGELIPVRYGLEVTESAGRLELTDERLENAWKTNQAQPDVFFFYRYQRGHPMLAVTGHGQPREKRHLKRETLRPDQSVLAQRYDPEAYPELSWVADRFAEMKLYRNWTFGRNSPAREPQKTDLSSDYLLEDAGNLGLVLNDLLNHPTAERRLLSHLTDLYPEIRKVHTRVRAGTVEIFLHERGLDEPVPASRLSDGTLRYLFMLAILCHPEPPPVICLEEPELGLHPRTLPRVAGLLKKVSQRTQLFVTTHSSYLLEQFDLEDIVVVQKTRGQTELLRPSDSAVLKANLEDFGADRIGELHRTEELELFTGLDDGDTVEAAPGEEE